MNNKHHHNHRQEQRQHQRDLAIQQWNNRVQQGMAARPAKAERVELGTKTEKKDEDKDQGRGR